MDEKVKLQGSRYPRGVYVNGSMLKAILKYKDISQVDLAASIGVHRNTIMNVIKENRIERLSKLFELCEYINIHPFILSEDPIYNSTKMVDGKETVESIHITPDNFVDYIDAFSYNSLSNVLYSLNDVESFFKANDKSGFIDLKDKIELYTNFVMKFRDKMVDMFISLDEQDPNKYKKYLKDNLYKELDKNE